MDAANEIMNNGGQAITVKADISDCTQINEMVDEVVAKFGRIDILINNSAIDPTVDFFEMTESIWDKVLDTNLKGAFFCTQACAQEMKKSGKGKVVSSPIEQLTDRELEVFRLIGEGCSTRQIAGQLHLSVRTVEAYREYIKSKLSLKNATELVQHAFHWVHHEAAA